MWFAYINFTALGLRGVLNFSESIGMGNESTFLTSDSNFLTGIASSVNIGGNFYRFNASTSGRIADMRALRSDWVAVGKDLSAAIKVVETKKIPAACQKR